MWRPFSAAKRNGLRSTSARSCRISSVSYSLTVSPAWRSPPASSSRTRPLVTPWPAPAPRSARRCPAADPSGSPSPPDDPTPARRSAAAPTSRSRVKPTMLVRRRRGRPSVTPSRSTKQTGSCGAIDVADARAEARRDEREVRVGVPRLDRALLGRQILRRSKLVVLVAGALREHRPEDFDVRRDGRPSRASAAPRGSARDSRRSCGTSDRGGADRRRAGRRARRAAARGRR